MIKCSFELLTANLWPGRVCVPAHNSTLASRPENRRFALLELYKPNSCTNQDKSAQSLHEVSTQNHVKALKTKDLLI
jgi:hypothetical protein